MLRSIVLCVLVVFVSQTFGVVPGMEVIPGELRYDVYPGVTIQIHPTEKSRVRWVPGDANLDGEINVFDFGIFQTNFGKTSMSWWNGDFNDDHKIDILDWSLAQPNMGSTRRLLEVTQYQIRSAYVPWIDMDNTTFGSDGYITIDIPATTPDGAVVIWANLRVKGTTGLGSPVTILLFVERGTTNAP